MNVRSLAALAVMATAFMTLVPTAVAHKNAVSPDGAIKISWGFLNEPAITETKNGLDLRVMDNATGYAIPDLQSVLHVEMHYGDEEMAFDDLTGQFGKPGHYTAVITPSRPGVYTLHVSGTVNGTELDMEIPAAHEIGDIQETYFPRKAEAGDLEARVAALEAKVSALEAQATAQAQETKPVATATGSASNGVPGLGLVGILAAVGIVVALRSRAQA